MCAQWPRSVIGIPPICCYGNSEIHFGTKESRQDDGELAQPTQPPHILTTEHLAAAATTRTVLTTLTSCERCEKYYRTEQPDFIKGNQTTFLMSVLHFCACSCLQHLHVHDKKEMKRRDAEGNHAENSLIPAASHSCTDCAPLPSLITFIHLQT